MSTVNWWLLCWSYVYYCDGRLIGIMLLLWRKINWYHASAIRPSFHICIQYYWRYRLIDDDNQSLLHHRLNGDDNQSLPHSCLYVCWSLCHSCYVFWHSMSISFFIPFILLCRRSSFYCRSMMMISFVFSWRWLWYWSRVQWRYRCSGRLELVAPAYLRVYISLFPIHSTLVFLFARCDMIVWLCHLSLLPYSHSSRVIANVAADRISVYDVAPA